jgi:hypothetical protein
MSDQTRHIGFRAGLGPACVVWNVGGPFLFITLEVKKMNELIKVTEHGGRPGVNARDLHGRLGVGRDFSNWIKDRIEKYGLVGGVDYEKSQSPNLVTGKDENLIVAKFGDNQVDETCKPNLASEIDEDSVPNFEKPNLANQLDSPNLGNQADETYSPNLGSRFDKKDENLIIAKFGYNQVSSHGGKREGAGRPEIDYILSIPAAMAIASGENSPIGVEITKALANQVGQTIENRAQTIENLTAAMRSHEGIIAEQGESIQLLEKRHDDLEDSVKNHIHYLEEGFKKMAEERRFENQRVLDSFMAVELDMTGGRTSVLDAYRIYVEKYDGKLSLREFGLDVPFRKTYIRLIHTKEGAFWDGCRLRRGKED